MRTILAVIRLALLYVALCGIGVAALLQYQAERERGAGAMATLPLTDSPAYDLPFSGINVQLEQYQSRAERIARLELLEKGGFGWVRQRVDWASIEIRPGVYSWEPIDAMISDIRSTNLKPVIVLDGSPAWARASAESASGANPLAPPADLNDFADFVGAFAHRYADNVRFYEIWNEPNIAPHWGDKWINPVEYAQMLRLASTAIRNADSDAVILMGALAPASDRGHQAIDEVHFLQRMYAAGAQPYFDAVVVQPFGFGRTAEDATQRLDVLSFHRAQLVRQAMVAAGDHQKPIIAARYGWNNALHSPWRTVSSENQRTFTTQALEIAFRDWPWLAAMGYAIDQPNADKSDPVWGFSLNTELHAAIAQWHGSIAPREDIFAGQVQRDYRSWAGLMALALLVLWRAFSASRIPPWLMWQTAYLKRSPVVRGITWAVVLLIYYISSPAPLVGLYLVAMSLLVLAQPITGLWLAAAVLPFYFQLKVLHFGAYSVIIAPSTAAALAIAPALLTSGRHAFTAVDKWNGLAYSWLGVIVLSAFGVWHWPAYWNGVLEFACTPLILFWSVRAFTHAGHARRSVLYAMLLGALAMAVIGLGNWLAGGGTEADAIRRLTATYYSANHAALYLVRVLFVVIGLALYQQPSAKRRWLLLAASLLFLTLLLTASRGASLLGVPVGAAVMAMYAHANARRRSPFSLSNTPLVRPVVAVGVVLLVSTVGAVIAMQERLMNIETIISRLQLWKATLELLKDYWITGMGPHGFYWRFPTYIPAGSALDPNILHPHNVWLEYAANGGVVALLWLLAAIVVLTTALYRAYREQAPAPAWPAIGVVAAFAAALAHAQVDAFSALPDLAAWNWLALGLIVAGLTSNRHTPDHNTRV